MPIRQILAPEKSVVKYTGWLTQRKPKSLQLKKTFTYEKALPHKVYHAQLSDILSEVGFSQADVVSWRHLHTDQHGTVAVETRVGKRGQYQVHEVHSGHMVDALKELYPALKKKKEIRTGDYEYSFLRLFSLKICAVWLRADSREADYFMPLPPCFYGLERDKLYTCAEFTDIVRKAIQTLQAKTDTYGHPMQGG
ncbi:hypothetical protein GGR92_005124 [Spirosoma lacussanchae]|uniref:hypothetical protein n=1 Tax=Spirosoma lacussanchae TaxID=1884249 RepID=UPI001108C214|nr:hypothetical protein [Spirosoma lacussanchae]